MMAQSWVCAGMPGVELCGAWAGLNRGGGAKTSSKHQQHQQQKLHTVVRCSGGEGGEKKNAPRRHSPSFGSSGRFSKSAPGLGQFKHPNLFGLPAVKETTEEEEARVAAILEQLRGGFGTWQERAAAITELQKAGFGSEEVYSQAYVPPPTQTSMVVAAQVYQSMEEAGCSPELLSWFDESKVDVLYSLRTLSANQRRLAAEYVMDNNLDARGGQDLARAIKGHERRPEGREGFSPVPGDCLAFSLHRLASESTNAEEKSSFIEQGLAVAVTDSAKQRFAEFQL